MRVLLATDAASEGIDLHRACHRLVHMEVPFNPNRMEQRNGRIDRHGQKSDTVDIFHFASAVDGTDDALGYDHSFLLRVAEKVDDIRDDLGSVSSVLAERIASPIDVTNLELWIVSVCRSHVKDFLCLFRKRFVEF